MCTIFHSVLEFEVRHSNKGPTLTADKNWNSLFYTSESKYKRAYKNWKRRGSKQSKSLINRSNYSPNLEILYKKIIFRGIPLNFVTSKSLLLTIYHNAQTEMKYWPDSNNKYLSDCYNFLQRKNLLSQKSFAIDPRVPEVSYSVSFTTDRQDKLSSDGFYSCWR